MKKFLLSCTVFITGASILILELLASRMLAPYLGTSIMVWTALIGGILASLSIGYALGGKLADRTPTIRRLAIILFIAAALLALLMLFERPLLIVLSTAAGSIQVKSILAVLLLFAPASMLLAMATPYTLRLSLEQLETSGQTAGRLYAIGTIGSIVGTVLCGFVLIPLFSHQAILLSLVIVLAILALFLSGIRHLRTHLFFAIMCIGVGTIAYTADAIVNNPSILLDTSSAYHRIIIEEYIDHRSNRPIRALRTDRHSSQSIMFVDSPYEIAAPYMKYYQLSAELKPNARQALMIGGGAYSFAKDFLTLFPEGELAIVEIDPKITALAKEYFYVPNDPRLHMYHEDGRVFLRKNRNTYDLLFLDAFLSFVAIPHHLATEEAIAAYDEHLSEDGLLFVNLIGRLDGDGSAFVRTFYKTVATRFPHIIVFGVEDGQKGSTTQNIVLIAGKKPFEIHGYEDHLVTISLDTPLPVLRDDYAPVDQYILPLLDAS